MKVIKTSDYNIDNTGKVLVTKELQKLIDDTSKVQGKLIIEEGTYLISSLFLKSNMEFEIAKGAMLLATTDESQYPIKPTRVAGVEMKWYVGVVNIENCENVTLSGTGSINGSGEYWWNKYWGTDYKSGMRKEYDAKGLRWVVDYDCMRVRNLVVDSSKDIVIKEFQSMKSGFWNVHILYSENVVIDDIKIADNGTESPSTDGIDIDSSSNIIIQNCTTSCHDDSICIKSGRDGDGFRVAKPCHDILVRNCTILEGMGMTIGSEVTGGVYNVKFENIKFQGTDCGFRIKSSLARKGYIKNIEVNNIEMINVRYPFNFALNWNPEYSICKLPENYHQDVPEHWEALLEQVPQTEPNTLVEEITITNVKAYNTDDYQGESRAFNVEGFVDQTIKNITFENVEIKAKEFGALSFIENFEFKNSNISVIGKNKAENDIFDHR